MGLRHSKLFKTTPNSSNSANESNQSCNAYSPTEHPSLPAKNLPPHPFYNLNCSTEWSPTAKTFPLLRLPFFALLEVFKSLDPIELFILSQCSRKIENCVHIAGTKKWKLSVDVGHKQIIINNTYRLIIIETPQKPSWKYDEKLKTFFLECQSSRDNELEFQQVLSKVQAAFKCPVPSFAYTGWSESDQCWFTVLKHITQNQIQPLESLDLCGRFKNEDLKWVSQNVKVTRKVNIHLFGENIFSTDFQPQCERLELMIFKSCKYIELALSSYTMRDLEKFIKEWKTGSFPNLQYLLIKRCKLNWEDRILGFKRDEMRRSFNVKRRLRIDENLSVHCDGGVYIGADNGTRATMQVDRVFSDSFELFVWKN